MVTLKKLPSVSPLHESENYGIHWDLYGYSGKEHVKPVIIKLAETEILVGISEETGKWYPVKFKP